MNVIDSFTGRWEDLSNFGPSTVTIYSQMEGREIEFPTGEHAFQWAKFDDPAHRARILAAPSPLEAKKLGRTRQVPLRRGWQEVLRFAAMRSVVEHKFTKVTSAGLVLLQTGSALLVEGNRWHDNDWGDCRCGGARCAAAGSNFLGWMLMERRVALGGRRPDTVAPH